MRKPLVLVSLLAVLAYAVAGQVEGKSKDQVPSDRQTRRVVEAAVAFVQALDADQRSRVQFAFIPQKASIKASFHRTSDGGVAPGAPIGGVQRGPSGPGGDRGGPPPNGIPQGAPPNGGHGGGFGQGPPGGFVGEQYGSAVWSNYPVSDVTRPGLRLGALTAAQRDAAMHLLQAVLSPMGYEKVRDIMGSDQALADAGTNFASGEAVYTIALFGEPSLDKPWMLEFGGHHLGLNIVFDGSNGVMTPTLTGAQRPHRYA